MNHPKVTI